MNTEIGILVYSLCIFTKFAVASEWSYAGENGPPEWHEDAPDCAGNSQSPVDIVDNKVLIDSSLETLKFNGYDQTLGGGTFVNNGHSVQLNFPANKTFKLSGGGMGDNVYTALQLHFHWSAPGSNKGSEHTINGVHYPVEMHIVHIKDPYTSTDQIKDMNDGLAVLGVFLIVGTEDNQAFDDLFKVARHCTYEGMKAPLPVGPRLFSLLPDSGSFYRYSGSLTTPPCYQTVTWTVLHDPVMISEQQLEMLQSLKSTTLTEAENAEGAEHDDDNLGGNYRPVQPLNGRIVTSYLDIRFTVLEKEHQWTYDGHLTGTSKWSATYPICGRNRQSPIDIVTSKLKVPKTSEEGDLVFTGYEDKVKGTFANNGHAVQLTFGNDLNYVITKGGLDSSYKALQLHFHWGQASANGDIEGGSEHTLDKMHYPAEMHIVHGKISELSNLSSPDSIVVLGIFVAVRKSETGLDNDEGANPEMQSLFDAISKVQYSGAETEFPSGPSLQSLLPKDKSFYRYEGSLTTPPCSETVIWTVFPDPIVISVNQFIAFQRLFSSPDSEMTEGNSIKIDKEMSLAEDISNAGKALDSSPPGLQLNSAKNHLLRNNYRPVQELNDRTIYYYQASSSSPSPTAQPVEPPCSSVWQIAFFCCMRHSNICGLHCNRYEMLLQGKQESRLLSGSKGSCRRKLVTIKAILMAPFFQACLFINFGGSVVNIHFNAEEWGHKNSEV